MHQILSAEEIKSERSSIPVKPHYVAQAPDFPLNLLSDRQFEILVYELLKAKVVMGGRYDTVSILSYGADKGRDVLLYKGGSICGIVQCKRYASSIGIGGFVSEICKLAMFSLRDKSVLGTAPQVSYQLWTSSGITEELRAFIAGDDTGANIDALIPETIDKLRRSYRSLQMQLPGRTAEQEIDDVMITIARLKFGHRGAVDINQLLAAEPQVSRWFFRGPDDGPTRASTEEIGSLLDAIRIRQLLSFRNSHPSADGHYVERESLRSAFTEFQQAGAKALVVVGGSGFGKTTWLLKLLEQSDERGPINLVHADDIIESDDSLISTLSRHLLGGRLRKTPSRDLQQAVWDWTDSANGIILIDGLDRAPHSAQLRLHRWLIKTVEICQDAPVRFVITTRPETWSLLWPQLDEIKPMLFEPAGGDHTMFSMGAISIPPLDWSEASDIYSAYGMDIRRYGINYLRTPSMIANAARLEAKGELTGEVPTRMSILEARIEDAVKDVGRRAGTGAAAARHALHVLGGLIAVTEDGRVPLKSLPESGTASLMDEFARADLVRINEEVVRPEMDEIAEYLWASSSDFDTLFESCRNSDASPLKVGATSISIALLYRNDPSAAHSAIQRMLDAARTEDIFFEASARAVAECGRAQWLQEGLTDLTGLWKRPNLYLFGSDFGQLLYASGLSPLEHLKAIFPLAEYEELDDWRTKFVLGSYGRFVTLFAECAERHLIQAEGDALPLLASELDSSDKRKAVARYLLHVACARFPAEELQGLWTHESLRRHQHELTSCFPEKMTAAMAIHLQRFPEATRENVLQLYHTARSLYEKGSDTGEFKDLAESATVFLDGIFEPVLRSKLLLCLAMHDPAPSLQKEIFDAYDILVPDDLWLAIGLMGEYRAPAIEKVFGNNGSSGPDGRALAWMGMYPTRAIPFELWKKFNALAVTAIESAEESAARNVALGLETLMYTATSVDQLFRLRSASMEACRSPSAEVRRPLTYYCGSPAHRDVSNEIIEFKDELFWELVKAEDGSNLQVVGWKILQSAHERRDAPEKLQYLVDKFGLERTMSELSLYVRLERNAGWVLEQLRIQIPEDDSD